MHFFGKFIFQLTVHSLCLVISSVLYGLLATVGTAKGPNNKTFDTIYAYSLVSSSEL